MYWSLSFVYSSISALANMYRYSTSPNTQPIDINRKKGYTRGNMTAYIVDQASGKNLGYFNRHYFVAATFEGQDDNGTIFTTSGLNFSHC